MTNNEIILKAAEELAENGVIKTKIFHMRSEDGELSEVTIPETIHTYTEWKNEGFQVQKGQKAIAKIRIWKYATKKRKNEKNEEENTGRMFMTTASFFSESQVTPIE